MLIITHFNTTEASSHRTRHTRWARVRHYKFILAPRRKSSKIFFRGCVSVRDHVITWSWSWSKHHRFSINAIITQVETNTHRTCSSRRSRRPLQRTGRPGWRPWAPAAQAAAWPKRDGRPSRAYLAGHYVASLGKIVRRTSRETSTTSVVVMTGRPAEDGVDDAKRPSRLPVDRRRLRGRTALRAGVAVWPWRAHAVSATAE